VNPKDDLKEAQSTRPVRSSESTGLRAEKRCGTMVKKVREILTNKIQPQI
jgi:hypothetical protein